MFPCLPRIQVAVDSRNWALNTFPVRSSSILWSHGPDVGANDFFLRISTYFDVLRNIFILHLDLLGGPRQSLGRAPRAHRSHCVPMDLDVNKSHPVPSHVKDTLFVNGFFGDQESWRDRNWRRSFRNETRKEEKQWHRTARNSKETPEARNIWHRNAKKPNLSKCQYRLSGSRCKTFLVYTLCRLSVRKQRLNRVCLESTEEFFSNPHKSFIVAQVEEEGSEKIASQKSKPYEVPRWKSSYVPSTETLRRERNKLDEEYVGKKSSFLLNFIHLLLLILFLLRVQAASSPPKTHIFICWSFVWS